MLEKTVTNSCDVPRVMPDIITRSLCEGFKDDVVIQSFYKGEMFLWFLDPDGLNTLLDVTYDEEVEILHPFEEGVLEKIVAKGFLHKRTIERSTGVVTYETYLYDHEIFKSNEYPDVAEVLRTAFYHTVNQDLCNPVGRPEDSDFCVGRGTVEDFEIALACTAYLGEQHVISMLNPWYPTSMTSMTFGAREGQLDEYDCHPKLHPIIDDLIAIFVPTTGKHYEETGDYDGRETGYEASGTTYQFGDLIERYLRSSRERIAARETLQKIMMELGSDASSLSVFDKNT